MRYRASLVGALSLVASLACAQATGGAQATTQSHTVAAAAAHKVAVSAQLARMQTSIDSQQRQIEQLMQQVQSRDRQIEQLQQQVNQVLNTARQAEQAVDAVGSETAAQQKTVTAMRQDVTDLKDTVANTAVSLQETQARAAESPMALKFKGVTITPGGFLAAESVYRQRGLASDINTPFNSLPMPGSSQSNLSEFFATARQSRISMRVDGNLKNAKLTGYYETDWLSAATTSNNNQSNSYSLRQRQVWGRVALHGYSFSAGQMWSLITETGKGVDNGTEVPPLTIDPQYHVGFSWARQYGIRAAKNFGDKLWLAFSVENPQTTFAAHGNTNNFVLGGPGTAGGLFNPLANYSFNSAPDLIAKAAFEPGWGHFEVFGVVSRFRDRVFPLAGAASPSAMGAFNDSRTGGGVGANVRASFFDKHMNAGLHFLGGDGVGRYGTSGLPDATVRPDGTLSLIHSYQTLATLEWHSPRWDLYANAGGEYASRSWYLNSEGKGVGYGSPLFVNTGCNTETLPGTNGFSPGALANCTADTRDVLQGTLGFWYRFYKGPKGTVQVGPQYSYLTRNTWSGVGGDPHGIDNMVFTSFRYYLP